MSKSLGLEFWLPLPILGIVFWVGSGFLADRMLSRAYYTTDRLQTNMQIKGKPAKVVLVIKVDIKYGQGFSKVKVKTANSALKKLEFEFPTTDVSKIETAISRELGLSPEQVRQLVRYQVDYS